MTAAANSPSSGDVTKSIEASLKSELIDVLRTSIGPISRLEPLLAYETVMNAPALAA